jgi:hypothetical protein
MNPGNEDHESHYREGIHHAHRPYWKRAHRDWRVWVVLFFLFAALFVYVMSDDLALVPRGQRQHPNASSGQRPGK